MIFFSKDMTSTESVAACRSLIKKYAKGSYYDFGGIKIPKLEPQDEWTFFSGIFQETLAPYLLFENHFPDSMFDEHPGVYYGLERPGFEVTVKDGDIVFDAGSWIGDFAAYASKCGAESVYAFEPAPGAYQTLVEASKLNPNITAVNKGLGDVREYVRMFTGKDGWTSGNTLLVQDDFEQNDIAQVEVTTVDDFVRENKIPRVDFIKSDIEGFERNMLRGAAHTLREFAPKLAICTYHLPDDPEVLERVILEANEAYRIVHKPKILFAAV
ncbi:MAG: FkbM family methyltransferase [Synergistaceae bacterium]|jgi:FkbM family methyltransferase|nr:FkbM family methyltransferase [Synergistaceae bacterium]